MTLNRDDIQSQLLSVTTRCSQTAAARHSPGPIHHTSAPISSPRNVNQWQWRQDSESLHRICTNRCFHCHHGEPPIKDDVCLHWRLRKTWTVARYDKTAAAQTAHVLRKRFSGSHDVSDETSSKVNTYIVVNV